MTKVVQVFLFGVVLALVIGMFVTFAKVIMIVSEHHQQVPAQVVQPEIPKDQPTIPPTPSPSFMTGYNDGFYGTWLGPVRWAVENDYRAGWSLGSYDRTHAQPYRFKISSN